MSKKKIAILVRERQHEALRMAMGAILVNDSVDVFVMDSSLGSDEELSTNLQMLADLRVRMFSNNPDNNCEIRSTDEIAHMLPEYDVIIPY